MGVFGMAVPRVSLSHRERVPAHPNSGLHEFGSAGG
jgi:hypothetical protein